MAFLTRARLHRLTRDLPFLMKLAFGLALGGFAIASAVVGVIERTPQEQLTQLLQQEGGNAALEEYRELVQNLQNLDKLAESGAASLPKGLRPLALWLHRFGDHASGVDDAVLRQGALEHALLAISRSDVSVEEKALLSDYMTGRLSQNREEIAAATARVLASAKAMPPVPVANELMGYLHLADERLDDALSAFLKEGEQPEAAHSREKVWSVALMLRDKSLLKQLWQTPEYRNALSVHDREEAGAVTGNIWLQWTGILHRQWEGASLPVVVVALLAALLWYVVLVRSGERTRWRWAWPLLPVLAGVASIWPTLFLLNYQTYGLGMVETDVFPKDLYFNVMGTGMREELSKLLLFAMFLPWLLKQRSAGLAVVTGGFIGLGFSLEENIDYIARGSDAWGRLLTANFLHIALTGMTGHALYQMVRTRFHAAGQFAAVFVMAVVLHGFYNWAPEASTRLEYGQDLDLISLILLAVLAHQFYALLGETLKPHNGVISVLSIFIVGSGLLVGLGFISTAFATDAMEAVSAFGASATGLIPIAVFHVRKLGTW